MSKPQETRIGCYAVIHEGDKILLCRLCGIPTNSGKWTLPGGGLEFGETIEEAMVREVREETGLKVEPKSLLVQESKVFDFPHKSLHGFHFIFDVNVIGGELTHEVDGTTDLVEWVPISEVNPENAVDIVMLGIGSIPTQS